MLWKSALTEKNKTVQLKYLKDFKHIGSSTFMSSDTVGGSTENNDGPFCKFPVKHDKQKLCFHKPEIQDVLIMR